MSLLATARTQINAETLPAFPEKIGVADSISAPLIAESLSTLFAIFKEAAENPEKAAILQDFLAQTDTDILDGPGETLEQYGEELKRSGKSGLAKLLGPQLTDYIAPLAQSTGAGEGKVASALGTLAPFALAILAKQTQQASEVPALLAEDDLVAAPSARQEPPKEPAAEKSYLPDPNKKRERRPFPKRRAIALLLILALVAALLFWLVNSGIIPLPQSAEPVQTTALPLEEDWVMITDWSHDHYLA
ncbi:DUF937 domain-containing protein [Roseibacillus ishigakijimensis]|uniref:DUF937 domain-containing protein n=1 Tax=Roseibacillus ishigakijimensis TaxID=454146 RepID=A0A934RPD0_9BACT|nr:DUF937 domain-containing protein [Roseibacillus ishigakijimensis]MBK1834520.1 DUF937 domain-containing protein [Roseibacillus ishigakijimensis]